MEFTERFLKLPIKIQDKAKLELEGDAPVEDSFTYLLPSQIEEFYPTEDEEDRAVKIFTKSGRAFWVYLDIDRFKKLLNEHQA